MSGKLDAEIGDASNNKEYETAKILKDLKEEINKVLARTIWFAANDSTADAYLLEDKTKEISHISFLQIPQIDEL